MASCSPAHSGSGLEAGRHRGGRIALLRAAKNHVNIRISHSGSKAHHNGGARNQIMQDPCIYVVFKGPTIHSWWYLP